jgi:erythromycin esterase-like protein
MLRRRSDLFWLSVYTLMLFVASLQLFAQTDASLAAPHLIVSQPGEQAFVDWARRNAIPLKTVEAWHGFDDMAPLGNIVGNARIVELGEATHGTREFFQMKHRMVEYLATQKGFTIFSIEANMPEAYRLNDFVLNGIGDPKQLLKGMYFWTWDTEEVLDMILWMREFNRSGKGRIEFTGFDMQTPTLPLETVRQFVEKYDPAYSGTLESSYKDVSNLTSGSGQSFGVATAKFPVQAAAAGHHIRYSGYIKTQNIERGYAGLWWRVDSPKGTQPLAFDNMQDRGAKGTTPWTRYEISLDVPASAHAIYFGVLHPGDGAAWFDSLQIDIDGIPYKDATAFDLDFESDSPRGFSTSGKGYIVELDKTIAHSGRQSLQSRYVNPAANSQHPANTTQIEDACQNVFDHLTGSRSRFLAAGAPVKDTDWAIQNARLVLQFTQLNSGEPQARGVRDRSMAENIEWIADQNPGAKLIVWAHNGHVGYAPFSGIDSMGSHLRKTFGPQIVSFGFAFNQGSFRAFEKGKSVHPFTVNPAPDGSWDQALAATGIPLFALDLRRIPLAAFDSGPAARWLEEEHPSRSIGAVYADTVPDHYWSNTRQQDVFDAIFFVEKTSASQPVP